MTKRAGRRAPRVLMVEGKEEQYVLPWLLEVAGIGWPSSAPPVEIVETDGVTNLLAHASIEAELTATGLVALGLVVDSDHDPAGRWRQVRRVLTAFRSDIPERIDREGVVLTEPGQPRVGIWLMPDNLREGMLETLLNDLRVGDRALRDHADTATSQAQAMGAPFKSIHRDKALLHAWLAWQDPPGQALGTAAKARALDATTPTLAPFVDWFRRLFQI